MKKLPETQRDLNRLDEMSRDQLQAVIARTRSRITHEVDELKERVEHQISWERAVREDPLKFAGAAFAIGFVLAIA